VRSTSSDGQAVNALIPHAVKIETLHHSAGAGGDWRAALKHS